MTSATNSLQPKARRLRVLQCITRLGLGGAERVAFTLMRTLREEMDFAVYTVHGASADAIGASMRQELKADAIPWFIGTILPLKQGGMLPGAFALARAVRQFQPDLVHFHSETPEACGAMLARFSPRAARLPMVRTIHNSVFWRYWPRIGRWCDRQLERAHIACVSEAARTEFRRYRRDSQASPPPAQPSLIYNGVNLEPRPPRAGLLQNDRRRVLFAGRFEAQKGIDVLCHCLPLIRLEEGVTGELTLLGHGAFASLAQQLAVNPPPRWQVNIRPPVPDLGPVFGDFDLLVVPSRFEGLGLVAIEATLHGLPVVATHAPGLGEALPRLHPWQALPGDAKSLAACLGLALAEAPKWAAAVRSAQEHALERFSPTAMGLGYRQLYELAVGRHNLG